MTKLQDLMLACHNGACNTYALINALSKAMSEELKPHEVRDSLDVKYIIGHISYLIGESLGPSQEPMDYAFQLQQTEKLRSEQPTTPTP